MARFEDTPWRRAVVTAWAFAQGYTASAASWYEEEGVEAWEWRDPDGNEVGGETGGHDQMPAMPDELFAQLNALCRWDTPFEWRAWVARSVGLDAGRREDLHGYAHLLWGHREEKNWRAPDVREREIEDVLKRFREAIRERRWVEVRLSNGEAHRVELARGSGTITLPGAGLTFHWDGGDR
ncbi:MULTISPECIES: hypothetical protein [unclassified Methylobacterium]|uniref:hypothetical protein n=1 Tax=unclassified Methylobacterium TaxID=2615210 RepID=UPI000EC9CC21|nr:MULTISPECIES: hypothetical protein [unclassified Methylobacterium]GBU19692.1 hypothetical protein AwMethylo_39070 [Methylobacterium sp.]